MRVALLDDYQGVALRHGDWTKVEGATVVPFRDHVHDEDELASRLADFDAVLRIRERTEFPRSLLARLPRLKLILATGIRNKDSIDLAAARELGITVCSTEALQRETVELTWGLILLLFRGLPREMASLRAGGWQLGVGRRLTGKTLGIVGFGTMGIPVSRVALAFEMKVIAWSPNLTAERTEPHGVQAVSREQLFSQADAITLHLPLSDRSRGLVNATDIGRMKRDAVLVNTSRAPLVDQDALIAALRDGRIGGLGVDVYESEPLAADHPFRLLQNVVATPHIGYVTQENYDLFYGQSVENLQAYIAGKPMRVIN
ncbi:D-2-hydroxyacid dehydrogenase family protein [Variovorax sp. KK3]|uniref:D-2-hydroxyacid dehydrogenase family protein n=1 Tax=Variovorax sp. KK3 TaxID=1855728 RepID=UPI00097C3A20|nr:D-2-hydroxyacid dehydrogenase family protein [Variovorax sp. KK3]